MGTIETCPRCSGDIHCHFSETNGVVVISGQCHYCGKLVAYRLSPSEKERAEVPKPLGRQVGWRLTCLDHQGREHVREYGRDEKALLDRALEDAKGKMIYWRIEAVRV